MRKQVSMEKLGGLIRLEREKQGLTQEELAKKMDMPVSYVCKAEAGKRVITVQAVLTFCCALNLAPNQLLNSSIIEEPEN